MKLAIEIPDGTDAAELVTATAKENGLQLAAVATLILQAHLEGRAHGLRKPGDVARRVAERKAKGQAAKQGRAGSRGPGRTVEEAAKEARPAQGAGAQPGQAVNTDAKPASVQEVKPGQPARTPV